MQSRAIVATSAFISDPSDGSCASEILLVLEVVQAAYAICQTLAPTNVMAITKWSI